MPKKTTPGAGSGSGKRVVRGQKPTQLGPATQTRPGGRKTR